MYVVASLYLVRLYGLDPRNSKAVELKTFSTVEYWYQNMLKPWTVGIAFSITNSSR